MAWGKSCELHSGSTLAGCRAAFWQKQMLPICHRRCYDSASLYAVKGKNTTIWDQGNTKETAALQSQVCQYMHLHSIILSFFFFYCSRDQQRPAPLASDWSVPLVSCVLNRRATARIASKPNPELPPPQTVQTTTFRTVGRTVSPRGTNRTRQISWPAVTSDYDRYSLGWVCIQNSVWLTIQERNPTCGFLPLPEWMSPLRGEKSWAADVLAGCLAPW